MRSSLNVLVMGVHRSGTSAVAGALEAAGFSTGAGGAAMLATPENPTGYGERRDLMELDDRLLSGLGWTWDAPAPEPLGSPPGLAERVQEGRVLVEERLMSQSPWFLKDPRLSLLLPWWRQILLERFVAVVCIRSAEEVAWSLSVRNGFPEPLGLALVGAYQRHLAKGLDGLPVVVVDYIALTEEPATVVRDLLKKLERLGAGGPFDEGAAVASIHPLLRRATHPTPEARSESMTRALEKLGRSWSFGPLTAFERFHLDGEVDAPEPWETAVLDLQRSLREEQARTAHTRWELGVARDQLAVTRARLAKARGEAMTARLEAEAAGPAAALPAERTALPAESTALPAESTALPAEPTALPAEPVPGADDPADPAAASALDPNPLFDSDWYLATYPDVKDVGVDALEHYRRFGVQEGRDPNASFATDWYLALYPEVRESGENPLDHYLRVGAAKGLDPGPLFDTDWYVAQNPDVATMGINPLLHYLQFGAREGRQPHPNAEGGVGAGTLSPQAPERQGVMDVVAAHVPSGATVALVTDPGTEPVEGGGITQAFPTSREAAAAAMTSATAAIAHLEAMRAQGTDYLVAPHRSSRYLVSLPGFAWHLETRYARCTPAEEEAVIYDLRKPLSPDDASWSGQVRRAVDEFRDRYDREPAILDRRSGLDLAVAAPESVVFAAPDDGSGALPYLDASIDFVAVGDADAGRLADAERVAQAAVLRVSGSPGDARVSVIWRPDQPEVLASGASIVIPTYNGLPLVQRCLQTLDETIPDYLDVEIIVVDDGSTDGSGDALARLVAEYPRASLLSNESNLGYIGAVNRGASAAAREYLVLLNNDTILLPGWLSPLLRTFRDRPDTGAVGGRLIYPDGRLQEAGGIIFSDGSAANYGHGDPDPDAPQYSYLREVDYVSGALLATPTAVFRDLGGLDTEYGFGYYDDGDYCFRLRMAGLRTYLQPESAIVHLEGGTVGTDVTQGTKRYQAENREIFLERWREELQHQPPPPGSWDRRTLYALASGRAA